MKRIVFSLIIIVTVLTSCEKKDDLESYLNSYDDKMYYQNEILPKSYTKLYGLWKINDISGGFVGTGYEPNFDYIEFKKFGIYGIIKDGSVVEYGKIEITPTLHNDPIDMLKIRIVPEEKNIDFSFNYEIKFIDLNEEDKLNLISPCCDLYNYHFERMD